MQYLGGRGAPVCSTAFNRLLVELAEQYERDVAAAVRQVKSDMGDGRDSPTSIVSVTVSGTPAHHSLPNMPDEDRPVQNNAWQEPRAPSTEKPGGFGRHPECAPSVHPCKLVAEDEEETDNDAQTTPQYKPTKSRLELEEDDNPFRRFIKSSAFDRLSAALLVSNAVFIGVQVENSFSPEENVTINAVDYVFCVCFIIELFARLWGFGCSTFWCAKGDRAWNIFDFVIVALSTVDTLLSILSLGEDSALSNISVLRVIRIVRITRVLRIIRVMKFFQDLRILVAAIASTLKTAFFALMLIFFMMYMFGIAVTQLVAEHVKEMELNGTPVAKDDDLYMFFGSIFSTMLTLFMTISGGIDWKDAGWPLFDVSPIAVIFYLLYVVLMVLCVMNVLTGMFCQSAIDTAASDRENVIQLQLQEKHRFVDTLQQMFAEMSDGEEGKLKQWHFEKHLERDHMQALLRSLEIEVRDAITLFELLDTNGSGEVDVEEFVTGCITLRGGAKAVHMEKVSNMNKIFTTRFDEIDKSLEDLSIQSRLVLKEFEKMVVFSSEGVGAEV
eukprot:TRINITY_DN3084_c0_g3_i1.p1 TRINITY_DN3084_c0_g3~~TRINITY_DN3084_c0_g3_i1.p1  ORF type:complete len:555 (-),score=85.20 TRINITY_DN3084_c0_g3_i1:280-1944(-)